MFLLIAWDKWLLKDRKFLFRFLNMILRIWTRTCVVLPTWGVMSWLYGEKKQKRGERRPRCFSPLWITQPTQHSQHNIIFLFACGCFVFVFSESRSWPGLLPSPTIVALSATIFDPLTPEGHSSWTHNNNLRMSTVLQKENAKASADRAVTRRTLSLEEKGGWAKECWPLRRAEQQSCWRPWSKVRTT